jgi:ATP-dependent RNA helicase DeaD
MVWFRMNIGRRNNADPRWLVPVICRVGHVTKRDIGVIRIADRETRFEITKSAAPRFASAARRTNDEDVRIEPAVAEHGPAKRGKRPDGKGGAKKAPRRPASKHERG